MATKLDLLSEDTVEVAKQLIGWRIYAREADSSLTGGTIIETEAYTQDDAASHSYRGKTAGNKTMFGPAGRIYVYFTYGMHWCVNIVTGPKGRGEAVLIRSIQPDSGIDTMRQRRGFRPDKELTNGPAKLCQALAITGKDNGAVLNQGRFVLKPPKHGLAFNIIATKRIGIKHDTHRQWRFVAGHK